MSSAGFFEADDIKNGGIFFYKSPGSSERGINFYKSFVRHLKKIKFPLDIFENI